ncbi:hypothetical protein D3C87_1405540 [compost metagenome]
MLLPPETLETISSEVSGIFSNPFCISSFPIVSTGFSVTPAVELTIILLSVASLKVLAATVLSVDVEGETFTKPIVPLVASIMPVLFSAIAPATFITAPSFSLWVFPASTPSALKVTFPPMKPILSGPLLKFTVSDEMVLS